MSSQIQDTILDVQITEARVKGTSLIVKGTATAARVTIDTSPGLKPMVPMDDSDWFVDDEIDPLPGEPIGPDIPGVNEDEIEDITNQIQEVAVGVQIGTGVLGAFEQAVPTGSGSAVWSTWTFTKQLSSFNVKKRIIVKAQVRMGAKVDTATTQLSGLPILSPNFALAKH